MVKWIILFWVCHFRFWCTDWSSCNLGEYCTHTHTHTHFARITSLSPLFHHWSFVFSKFQIWLLSTFKVYWDLLRSHCCWHRWGVLFFAKSQHIPLMADIKPTQTRQKINSPSTHTPWCLGFWNILQSDLSWRKLPWSKEDLSDRAMSGTWPTCWDWRGAWRLHGHRCTQKTCSGSACHLSPGQTNSSFWVSVCEFFLGGGNQLLQEIFLVWHNLPRDMSHRCKISMQPELGGWLGVQKIFLFSSQETAPTHHRALQHFWPQPVLPLCLIRSNESQGVSSVFDHPWFHVFTFWRHIFFIFLNVVCPDLKDCCHVCWHLVTICNFVEAPDPLHF